MDAIFRGMFLVVEFGNKKNSDEAKNDEERCFFDCLNNLRDNGLLICRVVPRTGLPATEA
jgi:hypothetical protein